MKKFMPFLMGLLMMTAAFAVTPVQVLRLPDSGGKLGDAVIDLSGNVHAVWLQNNSVFYAVSTDHGQNFSKPLQVNAAGERAMGGLFRGPQMSLGRDGIIHVIWYPDQSALDKKDWGVRYARLAKGATQFSDPINLGHIPSDNYSLAADGHGQVAIIWTTERVYVALSQNDGESFASPQFLPGLDPCDCCETAPAYDLDGKLSLLYRDKLNDDRNIYYAADALNAPDRRTRLNQENWHINGCPISGNSLVRLPGDAFAAGWEEKGKIYVTLSSSNSDNKEIEVGSGKYPKVLDLSGEGIFIGWKQGATTNWKILTLDGTEKDSGTLETPGSFGKFGVVFDHGSLFTTP